MNKFVNPDSDSPENELSNELSFDYMQLVKTSKKNQK
jgi:hypothetical protein